MKNLIKQIILEKVTKTKVICDNCKWKWNIKDGGKDPYLCHKCGHDNTPKKKLKEEKLPENREGGEVFPYKGDEYLIQKEKEGQISAFSIINNENVPLETIPNQNLKSFQNPLAVSKDVVKNADITKPIIIGDTGDAYFVLDGNHRLTKAMMKGKDIQAYVLSPEQTEKIKLKYGRPKKKLNENLQSNVIFLPYSDDYNEELEDYNIDEYDVEQQTLDIAKENNLNILRDKNLKGFLFDTTNNKIVGALWTSDDNNSFSFDIAIDKQYQGLKLSHLLIKNAIEEYQIQSDYGNFNLPMEVDVINPMLANILKTKYNFRVIKRITNDRVIMALKKNLKELFDYENKPNKYLGDVINHHRDDSDNEIITIENDGYGMRLVITNHGGLSIKFDYKGTSKLTNKNEQYKVANFIIENLKKYINEKNITSITFSINDSNNKRFPIYEYALNKLNFFLERKIENNYFFKKNLNEQLLNEKLTELDLDVNRLYNHFFKKDIDEIKRTNIVTTNMFKSNSYNTSMLIEPQSIEGDKLNHCEILINKKLYPNLSNFYKPSLNIISLSINFNAVKLALDNDGDINKAMQNLYPQKLQNSFLNEFSEEKIKGSINHELLHWLDDTFNNKHIYQKLHPKSKFKLKNPHVDATKMEIQAQLGNIKQLKNKYQNSWNNLTFLEFINLSPLLTNIYGKLPQKYKVNWVKNLLSRMNRENLLGDNMKKTLNEQKDILNEKCWKKYTQKGMKTMFGKRYPNCVKKIKEDEDYRIQHKTPSKDYGATMDNLTKLYPNDIYSNKALQYYGEGYPYDRLAITIMQSAKDNPNKKIKIYRAVPKDVNTINNGDWVTITKQYAQSHGKSVMNNDYKVISKIVNASTLYTDGNSIHEFGYRI
jgi:hypothetical protein